MAESVKERILSNLVARLARITIANGYESDVASVQRYGLDGLSVTEVPVLYVSQGEDLVQTERKAFPATQRRLEVFVAIVTRPGAGESRSGDALLNSLGADVERCVMADGTHGGLAIKTESPDWMECAIDEQLPHLAIALRFTVDYRHDMHDPRVNR